MATGDVYKVTDNQTLHNQAVKNVYFYQQSGGSGGAEDLAQAFATEIFPKVKAFQVDALVHQNIEVMNLGDPGDWYTLPITSGGAGANAGASAGPFLAYAFRLNRTSRATRNGQKRYAGVIEGAMDNGLYNGVFSVEFAALSDALDDEIEGALGSTFVPVIVRTDPETGEPTIINEVGSAEFVRLTTQNTRKYGRGI